MNRKYNTESYIKKAHKIHNNFYNYDKTVYVSSKNKIIITCLLHGDFLKRASSHLAIEENSFQGCIKCGREISSKKCRLTTEEFINRALKIHGSRYDYSKSIYINMVTPIEIICSIHGLFFQTPLNHLEGCNCKKCANTSPLYTKVTKEQFIERANKIHNFKYDYSKINYVNTISKITTICPIHGKFIQQASCHLMGDGCSKCSYEFSNFVRDSWIKRGGNREGIFYIIKCFNETEVFFKLGITIKPINIRYSGKNAMPYNYEIIKEVKSQDLGYIWDLEKRFKSIKRGFQYNPKIKFAGCKTECFK